MEGRNTFILAGILLLVLLAGLFVWVGQFSDVIRERNGTPTAIPTDAPQYGNNSVEAWLPKMREWETEHGIPVAVQYVLMLMESGGQQYLEGVPIEWRGETLRAKGLFQVMPFAGRFLPGEDPFDPDINAREAFKWLTHCNRSAGGDWIDRDVLWRSFACYFGGSPTNTDSWGPRTRRYADVVLAEYLRITGAPSHKANEPSQEMPKEQTTADFPNRCFRADYDCSFPSDPYVERLAWEAGYWLGRGWSPKEMRQNGVRDDIALLAQCLSDQRSTKRCQGGSHVR